MDNTKNEAPRSLKLKTETVRALRVIRPTTQDNATIISVTRTDARQL